MRGLDTPGQARPGLARPSQAWPGQASPGLADALFRGGGLCIDLIDGNKIETAISFWGDFAMEKFQAFSGNSDVTHIEESCAMILCR